MAVVHAEQAGEVLTFWSRVSCLGSRPNQHLSRLTFLWFYLVIPVEFRDSVVLTLPSHIILRYITLTVETI